MQQASPPDVFTLEEAAAYLRLPAETVLYQVSQNNLPGRKIDNTWRFLKVVIDDWLRLRDSRTRLLNQAGALQDDETLAELRAKIYQSRERPEIDEAEPI
ncbi:MAG: helix-turn-helix domain-containing protein [Oculatellaceae cyanobacterium Prado106]|jgi:excisionase family DNA binding protein|nr:helix-turn-helix domain-containing protein [Oculatellaceae cyanobacterium Prado106]